MLQCIFFFLYTRKNRLICCWPLICGSSFRRQVLLWGWVFFFLGSLSQGSDGLFFPLPMTSNWFSASWLETTSSCGDSWLRVFSLRQSEDSLSMLSSLDCCRVLSFRPGRATRLEALAGCTNVLLFEKNTDILIITSIFWVVFFSHSI